MIPSLTRPPWVPCATAGLVVLLFRLVFATAMPGAACGPAETPAGSLVAFQLSTSTEMVGDLFGDPVAGCGRTLAVAMDRANCVDLVFAPLYGVFTALFFAAMRATGSSIAWSRVGIALVLAAVGADWIETATQLRMTAHLPGTVTELTVLTMASRAKFSFLAATALVAACAAPRRGGKWLIPAA